MKTDMVKPAASYASLLATDTVHKARAQAALTLHGMRSLPQTDIESAKEMKAMWEHNHRNWAQMQSAAGPKYRRSCRLMIAAFQEFLDQKWRVDAT